MSSVVELKRRCRALTLEGEPCKSPFVAEGADFCSRHDPELEAFWRESSAKGGERRRIGRVTCALEGCSKRLPRGRAQWCSNAHRLTGAQRAQTERARMRRGELTVASEQRKPRPEWYDDGCHLLLDQPGGPTTAQINQQAERYEVDRTTIIRWYAWERQQQIDRAGKASWSPPPRDFPEKWRDLTAADVPALIADFIAFRATHVETEDEEPYLIAPFHERWIEALIRTFVTRGRLMILSPPRHGKTELLAHLVLWLICRFPNIRIIWVGPSDEIAEMVGQEVMDHLELNNKLIDAYCGPGGQFKPKGRGRSWNKSEMTVSTRTVFGIKSPTVRFQGRGGTLVSRDAEVIICDDIEQDKTVYQPGTREKTRNWASTSLFSRKTKRLAIAFIGSRQHPDDLWQHFLDNELFETIVEVAHERTCEIPQNDPERYEEHVSCMLWPELNDYAWLKELEILNETLGGRDTFEMVYLNRVSGKGLAMFEVNEIVACRDRSHLIGKRPQPLHPDGKQGDEVGGIRYVAGLDPSGSGYQAAFLWAFQVKPELHMWMVDIENHKGGGIAQARETIKGWHKLYQVSHWVVEENLYHGGIVNDEQVIALRHSLGIIIEPHRTQHNKWDPYLGVSTLKPLFANKTITLPYGDVDSKAKSDLYQRQLVYFSDAPRNRNTKGGYKSDVVMASWFPMTVIRRALNEFHAEMGIDYRPSYSSYTGSNWNTPPWNRRRTA